MQINKIDNQTSFNGMYKIPKTVKNMQELYDHVLPTYFSLKDEPVFLFNGSNPFNSVLDTMTKSIADEQGSSVNWLKINAANFGANLSDFGEEVLHIITGKKDVAKLKKYIPERLSAWEKETSLIGILTSMFRHKHEIPFDKKTPKHLRPLFCSLQTNVKETTAFRKFAQDKVISVKTPQELLEKMLMEK